MGLKLIQIEHLERLFGRKSHSRKWIKQQRNRKLRRTKLTEVPNTKQRKDYEY